jgi:hypothetical protein
MQEHTKLLMSFHMQNFLKLKNIMNLKLVRDGHKGPLINWGKPFFNNKT